METREIPVQETPSEEVENIQETFNQLLKYVANSNVAEAEAIVKNHPELIFENGSTSIFVNYTPCKLARYHHDGKMMAMFTSHLDEEGKEKLTSIDEKAQNEESEHLAYDFDGIVNAISQNKNIFQKVSDKYINAYYKEKNQLPDKYDNAVAEITALNTEAIADALHQFNEAFKLQYISNVCSYNTKHLQAAYEINDKFRGQWTMDQRLLFWNFIIKPLQELLPPTFQPFLGSPKPVEDQSDNDESYIYVRPAMRERLLNPRYSHKHSILYTNMEDEDRFAHPEGRFRMFRRSEIASVRFDTLCKNNSREIDGLIRSLGYFKPEMDVEPRYPYKF